MPLRVGILSVEHMHVWSYVGALRTDPRTELVGFWDADEARAGSFAEQTGVPYIGFRDDLLDAVDAVMVCSSNTSHADLIEAAANKGKAVLCEKPIGVSEEDFARIAAAAEKVPVMTAFPCRFSPAFAELKARVAAGEIGTVRAISATNRGRCPFGWFVEEEKSGGGAMIDHTVHVADLLLDLLGEEPADVAAFTGHNMYGQAWEDTAVVSMRYPSGVAATLDASWSRPGNYKTWGDVTMRVVGDAGVLDLDMFGQGLQHYAKDGHHELGTVPDLDAAMVDEFISAASEKRTPRVSAADGIAAARVALRGYASL
ncbi:Gfo/Idh/MocA family oxidoreductase [soil metagenome]